MWVGGRWTLQDTRRGSLLETRMPRWGDIFFVFGQNKRFLNDESPQPKIVEK